MTADNSSVAVTETLSPSTLLLEPTDVGQSKTIVKRPVPVWKRCFDIAVSLAVGVLLLPVLCAIAIYIKAVSRGPAIFRQQRLGHGGEYFLIFKFRTLHCQDTCDDDHRDYLRSIDRNKPVRKPSFKNRLITGGSILRKLSLDELPQLLNVLRGDMSLIGPRPDVLSIEDYNEEDLRRFEVLPGITGLWQVSGKNRLTQQEMIDLDTQYVDNMAPKLDLWITIRTFWILLRQDND